MRDFMCFIKKITMLLFFFTQAALADTVKLNNGDSLTGTVVRKETEKLIFKTKYAGEIKISWSEIASFKTDQPIKIVLADDSSFTGKVNLSSKGLAKVYLPKSRTNANLNLEELVYINPSPKFSGEGVTWKGNIDFGGDISQGNTDTSEISLDGEAIARTKQDRYTIGIEVNRGKANDISTEFDNRGDIKYDHFLTKQWYLYANGAIEKDKFRDIKLRSLVGGGIGYQFYEQPDLNLFIEGGLNYVNTDYDEQEDEDYPSGRWAIKYDQLIFADIVKLFHEQEVFFSLADTKDFLVFSKTGLRVPIGKNINASTQFDLDYNSEAPEGTEKLDKTLLFSLGYGW